MKKIGLVGGIGPASTVDYYLGLIERCKKHYGETVYPQIVIESVDLYQATKYFEDREWEKSAKLMVQSVANLKAAGAEIAAITANTEHIVWPYMKDLFEIPVVNIVEATVEEAVRSGYQKVLVLGTSFTMESGLYDDALKKKGIKPILPSKTDQTIIGNLIYPNLENGIMIPEDRRQMLSLVEQYIQNEHVDAVILGCTEIPLMIHEGDVSVPVLDTTQIHIDAIFRCSIDNAFSLI